MDQLGELSADAGTRKAVYSLLLCEVRHTINALVNYFGEREHQVADVLFLAGLFFSCLDS